MESITAQLTLAKKRDKPIRQGHPWIFSGAVAKTAGEPEKGGLATVVSSDGEYLATAYVNPDSQILGRILTTDPTDPIDKEFWHTRLQASIQRRQHLSLETNALRLINAESDGLPGLIVDKYDDIVVYQALTAGIDIRKKLIQELLIDLLKPKAIIERSDVPIRKKEGLPQTKGIQYGEPPETVSITENGIKYEVNPLRGHKTGWYLDQRDNRALVCAPRFVADKTILNLFSYTGGFGLTASTNKAAHVTHIDSSVPALKQAERNYVLNKLPITDNKVEFMSADAFDILRHYRDTGQSFDLIILDPPKIAHSKRDLQKATRAYKDLNWLALRLLTPNGLLATFSCSGLISADLFQKIVFGAAVDASREASIIRTLTQAEDHPVSLTFPESAYLKGFLIQAHS